MVENLNKRGQFYLLAAVIIVVLILGFATVTNYVGRGGKTKVYQFSEELGIESGEVLNFGVYNPAVNDFGLRDHFTRIYNEYAGEDKKIVYIFGDASNIEAFTYEEVIVGNIEINIGGTVGSLDVTERGKTILSPPSVMGDKVTVVFNRVNHEFTLKPGENFFFIILQENDGEVFVAEG